MRYIPELLWSLGWHTDVGWIAFSLIGVRQRENTGNVSVCVQLPQDLSKYWNKDVPWHHFTWENKTFKRKFLPLYLISFCYHRFMREVRSQKTLGEVITNSNIETEWSNTNNLWEFVRLKNNLQILYLKMAFRILGRKRHFKMKLNLSRRVNLLEIQYSVCIKRSSGWFI